MRIVGFAMVAAHYRCVRARLGGGGSIGVDNLILVAGEDRNRQCELGVAAREFERVERS